MPRCMPPSPRSSPFDADAHRAAMGRDAPLPAREERSADVLTAAATRTAPRARRAADAIVEVRGVGKFYGDVEALRDIDLDFPRGKLTSLLGPSGCGKTTLLKIIAGLIEADAGDGDRRRPPGHRPGPRARLRLPGFRADALGDGAAQRRLRAGAARHARGPEREDDRPPLCRRGRPRRLRAEISARAVRRHAPARRARPRARRSMPRCCCSTSPSRPSTSRTGGNSRRT